MDEQKCKNNISLEEEVILFFPNSANHKAILMLSLLCNSELISESMITNGKSR